VTALVGAAALLLLAAGAAKVADPTRTAGALAARGGAWAVGPAAVRAGAAVEAVLGAATLVVGGPVLAAAVGLSYAGFAAFVAGALRSGTPVGSCGCFGRSDTPPRVRHVAVDGALAAAGLVGAAVGADPLVGAPLAAVAAAVVLAGASYLALTAP
jgi:Methylamine utilisation protein MauE